MAAAQATAWDHRVESLTEVVVEAVVDEEVRLSLIFCGSVFFHVAKLLLNIRVEIRREIGVFGTV